jgi:hypothetical protein
MAFFPLDSFLMFLTDKFIAPVGITPPTRGNIGAQLGVV